MTQTPLTSATFRDIWSGPLKAYLTPLNTVRGACTSARRHHEFTEVTTL